MKYVLAMFLGAVVGVISCGVFWGEGIEVVGAIAWPVGLLMMRDEIFNTERIFVGVAVVQFVIIFLMGELLQIKWKLLSCFLLTFGTSIAGYNCLIANMYR